MWQCTRTCSKQNFDDKTSSLLASLYLVCSTEQGSITHQERCSFCQFWLHGSLVHLTGVRAIPANLGLIPKLTCQMYCDWFPNVPELNQKQATLPVCDE